jgi:anti-anti-sigma factor
MLTEWSAESASFEERADLDLAVAVLNDEAGPVIEVHGALVCGTADRLGAVVGELLEEGGGLVLDMRQLAMLDSAGVGVLLAAVDQAEATATDLRVRASPPAARLLDRTGVTAGARGRVTIDLT